MTKKYNTLKIKNINLS